MGKHLFNKFAISAGLLFNCSVSLNAQSDFTWKKGNNSVNQSGLYGTLGTGNATTCPGSREGAVSWKDASGNFWMFGGNGHDFIGNFGVLGDLWKYDPSNNQWTWKKGADIITTQGVYGTLGVPASANTPGARMYPTSWTDTNGNLWLFGGFGHNASSSIGYMNDLWKYNVTTNEWTWMNGSNTFYQVSSYGTQGTPSVTNYPGARQNAQSWTDASGNLWLFGGYGSSTSPSTIEYLNDLWKYDVGTNEWTWMNGSNLGNQNGSYGLQGTGASTNTPGARANAVTWTDGSGNLWLFGGDGWDAVATSTTGLLNDLWRYKTATNEWTWVKGQNAANQNGLYGSLGTPSVANTPGSRSGSASWYDSAGNLWLFGGEGFPANGTTAGSLNDLWKYNVGQNAWTWMQGTSLINMNGIYGTQNVGAPSNMPGGRANLVNWTDANDNLWLFGGYGKGQSGLAGRLNDLWKYTNCSISPITMTIVCKDSVMCAGETTSLTAFGSSNYQWLNPPFPSGPSIVISPTITTTYTVRTTDGNGCRYDEAFTTTVNACQGLSDNALNGNGFNIFPNPSSGMFQVSIEGSNSGALFVYDQLGKLVHQNQLEPGSNTISLDVPPGIYICRLQQNNDKQFQSLKLIISR